MAAPALSLPISQAKAVRAHADLAINGAPPAFAQPLHVGRPNIGDKEHFLQLIGEMIDRRWLSNDGPMVRQFEQRIGAYLDVPHVVVVNNATIGLELAIRALGLTGEVIVPSYTFVATAHAVHWQGITPVFADIDPRTHTLDPASVEAAITERTSGIIGVHLWGRPAPVEALQELADRRGLKLMYDAAHAFASAHKRRLIGSFGDCEVFSFHATKFLNSLEGGAITTRDGALADKLRRMRNFGFAGYDCVTEPGTNGKMSEACAAMGLVNLDMVERLLQVNRANYQAYAQGLRDVPGVQLMDFSDARFVNYQYVVAEIDPQAAGRSRDEIVAALHADGILARKYFWPGCHRMEPYASLFPDAARHLPNTEAVAGRVIVLPTGTAMDEEMIARVCDVLRVYLGK